MSNRYERTMQSITASEGFKTSTLKLIKEKEREKMNHIKKIIIGLAACMLIAVGTFALPKNNTPDTGFDLRDRIVIDADAPMACVAVNIEGVIVEVSDDGLSFKLDTGKWVVIDDSTEYGTTLPTSAAIEDQYLEATFRVGNSIAGFSESPDEPKVLAYAIYTNWNWDNPIK